jgi:hypothetical protein
MSSSIKYDVKGIKKEQFALIEDSYDPASSAGCRFNISYGSGRNLGIIAVKVHFTFEQRNLPVVILEVGCQFAIHSDDWARFVNEQTNQIIIPVEWALNLGRTAINISNGILYSQLEDSGINLLIPGIDLDNMIKEDIIIPA